MKLPPFEYACPTALSEAVALLAGRNGDAKLLAGGQSLVPMLAFRLAAPALLVDLRKLPELRKIEIRDNGVVLGAMVRWCEILADARLRTAHPLLCAAVAEVAHYQIRNRGTIGGSIAHADPAAEMPGIALVCEAQIATVGSAGARVIEAADFFIGPLTTVLEPDEIIVEIRLPAWPAQRRWGFQEFARRRGDFAMAAAAVWYDQDCGRQGAQPACGRDRGRRPAAAALRGGGGAQRPRDRRGRRSRKPRPRLPPPSIRRPTSMPAPIIAAPSPAPWWSGRC